MRKTSIRAVVITMCLALGTTPVMAQDATADPSLSTSPATIGQPAVDGARIVLVEDLGGRIRDLTIESPSVGTTQVRLLLPRSFGDTPEATFPVLYLLHGGGGGFDDWTQETRVGVITEDADLLVAMPAALSTNLGTYLPEGGPDGLGGPPNWERFHVVELPQLLERSWRAGDARAVAGLSLGGYGTAMYASRHPDFYDAAASFSGALDLSASDRVSVSQQVVDDVTAMAESMGWNEANPINLVSELKDMPLYISYGNGEPGPLDAPDREYDDLEAWIGKGNDSYIAALADAGIEAATNAYGPGTHSWSYWERELAEALPLLLEALADETTASQ